MISEVALRLGLSGLLLIATIPLALTVNHVTIGLFVTILALLFAGPIPSLCFAVLFVMSVIPQKWRARHHAKAFSSRQIREVVD